MASGHKVKVVKHEFGARAMLSNIPAARSRQGMLVPVFGLTAGGSGLLARVAAQRGSGAPRGSKTFQLRTRRVPGNDEGGLQSCSMQNGVVVLSVAMP